MWHNFIRGAQSRVGRMVNKRWNQMLYLIVVIIYALNRLVLFVVLVHGITRVD